MLKKENGASLKFIRFQFEFLDASAGACTYGAAIVLAMEWVGAKKRVFGATIIAIFYSVGEMLLGLVAMNFHNFRHFLLAIYLPGLCTVVYFWIVPESVRWLLAVGRFDRVEKIMEQAAKFNRREISAKALEVVRNKYRKTAMESTSSTESSSAIPLRSIFTSTLFMVRLIIVSYSWFVCTYVFYGLSLLSTQIGGDSNKYVSYMLVVAAQLPGYLIANYLMSTLGRRFTLMGSLILAGLSILGSVVLPASVTLLLWISGKIAISSAYFTIYVFTAEIWPTSLRQTLVSICSTFGRVGPMLAPLTLLLVGRISSRGIHSLMDSSSFLSRTKLRRRFHSSSLAA